MEWVESSCDFFTHPNQDDLIKFKKADKTWRVQIPYFVNEKGDAVMSYQRIFIRKIKQS